MGVTAEPSKIRANTSNHHHGLYYNERYVQTKFSPARALKARRESFSFCVPPLSVSPSPRRTVQRVINHSLRKLSAAPTSPLPPPYLSFPPGGIWWRVDGS